MRYPESNNVNSVCVINDFVDVQAFNKNVCKKNLEKMELKDGASNFCDSKTMVIKERAEIKMHGWPACGWGDPG